MATQGLRLALVLYTLAFATRLGTGKSLCALISGTGESTTGLCGHCGPTTAARDIQIVDNL